MLRRHGRERDGCEGTGEEGAERVGLFVRGGGGVRGAGEGVRWSRVCGVGCVGCELRGQLRRWGCGVVVFGDEQGGFENPGLDGLDFDGGGEVSGEVGVGFFEGEFQLAPYGHPFVSSEVAVLEEEEQGRGA